MNNNDRAIALGRFAGWSDARIIAFINLLDAYDAMQLFKGARTLVNDNSTADLYNAGIDAVKAAFANFKAQA